MAQLNSLLVTGNSRFLNKINGDINGDAHTLNGKTITDTYSSTSTDGMSGIAVKSAIDAVTTTNVTQTLTSSNWNLPLVMAYEEITNTTTNITNKTYRNNSIYANPSTGNIQATKLNGATIGSTPVFTDTKVTQTIDNNTSSDFRILFSGTADDTTRTEGSKKSANFKYNPSGQKLTVTNIDARSIVTGGVTAEGITSSGSLSASSLSLGSGAITCGAVNGSSGNFSSALFSLLLGLAYTDSSDVSHTIPLVNANPADGSIVIQSAFEQAIKDLNKWTLIDSVSGVLSDTTDKSVAIPSATLNACREILVITDLQLSNTVDQTFTRVIPYDEITATSPLGLGSTARRYLDSYMYSTSYYATLAYTVSSSAVTYDKNWSVVKNGSTTTTGYKFQIKVYWR